ncbi:MAG: hypothetical protein ACRDND_20570 [Streptosporangiaceae bacterium]
MALSESGSRAGLAIVYSYPGSLRADGNAIDRQVSRTQNVLVAVLAAG